MATNRITLRLEKPEMGGALNPALVSLDYVDGVTPDSVVLARFIRFVVAAVKYNAICPLQIAGATLGTIGVSGTVDMPYPVGPTADLNAVLKPIFGLSAADAQWGAPIVGDGLLTVRGSSINISETSDNPGRKGQGRMYLPYVSTVAVTSLGLFNNTFRAALLNAYNELFNNGLTESVLLPAPAILGISGVEPVVVGATAPFTAHPVTGVKISDLISVLKSRRK